MSLQYKNVVSRFLISLTLIVISTHYVHACSWPNREASGIHLPLNILLTGKAKKKGSSTYQTLSRKSAIKNYETKLGQYIENLSGMNIVELSGCALTYIRAVNESGKRTAKASLEPYAKAVDKYQLNIIEKICDEKNYSHLYLSNIRVLAPYIKWCTTCGTPLKAKDTKSYGWDISINKSFNRCDAGESGDM